MKSRFPSRRVTSMRCDVSIREDVRRFRNAVVDEHQTDSIEMLVNNAGIVGGVSFFVDSEEHWLKTFDVCWNGVYNCTREFRSNLVAAELAHIVNISSANGYWASSSFNTPLSAYSTAKFAVKGFTESLLVDSRLYARNIKPVLVMLGQVSTRLSGNSASYLGLKQPTDMSEDELMAVQRTTVDPMRSMPISEFRNALQNSLFGENSSAPTTPKQAAQEIWKAIERDEWRVVVGPGARLLDSAVRADPDSAYEEGFITKLIQERDAAVET